MAYHILTNCISCGICSDKCPNGAVIVNDDNNYAIDFCRCVECIDLPRRRCEKLCPVGAIQLDSSQRETTVQLWAKVRNRSTLR
jgi:ferredoxin